MDIKQRDRNLKIFFFIKTTKRVVVEINIDALRVWPEAVDVVSPDFMAGGEGCKM